MTTLECIGYVEGVVRVWQTRTFPTLLTVEEAIEYFDEMEKTATLFGVGMPRCQLVSMGLRN